MTIITPTHLWTCPNCPLEESTNEARPHTRYHSCPGLNGLTAPMAPAGTRVKITAIEREDYVGNEEVQTDDAGRPVMAVITEREDGSNDVTVFAPRATAQAEEH